MKKISLFEVYESLINEKLLIETKIPIKSALEKIKFFDKMKTELGTFVTIFKKSDVGGKYIDIAKNIDDLINFKFNNSEITKIEEYYKQMDTFIKLLKNKYYTDNDRHGINTNIEDLEKFFKNQKIKAKQAIDIEEKINDIISDVNSNIENISDFGIDDIFKVFSKNSDLDSIGFKEFWENLFKILLVGREDVNETIFDMINTLFRKDNKIKVKKVLDSEVLPGEDVMSFQEFIKNITIGDKSDKSNKKIKAYLSEIRKYNKYKKNFLIKSIEWFKNIFKSKNKNIDIDNVNGYEIKDGNVVVVDKNDTLGNETLSSNNDTKKMDKNEMIDAYSKGTVKAFRTLKWTAIGLGVGGTIIGLLTKIGVPWIAKLIYCSGEEYDEDIKKLKDEINLKLEERKNEFENTQDTIDIKLTTEFKVGSINICSKHVVSGFLKLVGGAANKIDFTDVKHFGKNIAQDIFKNFKDKICTEADCNCDTSELKKSFKGVFNKDIFSKSLEDEINKNLEGVISIIKESIIYQTINFGFSTEGSDFVSDEKMKKIKEKLLEKKDEIITKSLESMKLSSDETSETIPISKDNILYLRIGNDTKDKYKEWYGEDLMDENGTYDLVNYLKFICEDKKIKKIEIELENFQNSDAVKNHADIIKGEDTVEINKSINTYREWLDIIQKDYVKDNVWFGCGEPTEDKKYKIKFTPDVCKTTEGENYIKNTEDYIETIENVIAGLENQISELSSKDQNKTITMSLIPVNKLTLEDIVTEYKKPNGMITHVNTTYCEFLYLFDNKGVLKDVNKFEQFYINNAKRYNFLKVGDLGKDKNKLLGELYKILYNHCNTEETFENNQQNEQIERIKSLFGDDRLYGNNIL